MRIIIILYYKLKYEPLPNYRHSPVAAKNPLDALRGNEWRFSSLRGVSFCMEQQCGRKIGLLPTKAQIRTMHRMCAVSRRAYNWKLAVQNAAYEEAKAKYARR